MGISGASITAAHGIGDCTVPNDAMEKSDDTEDCSQVVAAIPLESGLAGGGRAAEQLAHAAAGDIVEGEGHVLERGHVERDARGLPEGIRRDAERCARGGTATVYGQRDAGPADALEHAGRGLPS